MKKLFYTFVIYGLVIIQLIAQTEAIVINYTGSNDIIANPERGFQKYSLAQASNYSLLSQTTLNNYIANDKITVIYRSFLLDSFMTSDISQTYLDNMQIDFDRIRTAGLKVIVRFSYTDNTTAGLYQPSKTQILSHISQLENILTTNKDIIFAQQAGFIGKYGEWYYTNSPEFGTEGNIDTTQWNNRKDVILAILAHTPIEIPLQVRAVNIKQTMFGTTPLNATTAYQNTPNARIGFYNDAFLNDYGDQGTYSVSSRYANPVGTTEYNYLSNETQYVPMGGETNGINSARTTGANAILEMDLTNFSTLNRDYYIPNFTNWIASNHYNEIERRLGYRFVLTSGDYQLNNNILSGTIQIKNEGFAQPFHNKTVNLVLKKTTDNTTYKYDIPSDIRTWTQSGSLSFSENIANIMTGDYDLFVEIIDPLLPNRAEYSIRFANENTWINNMNKLHYQITKVQNIAPVIQATTPIKTPSNNVTPSLSFISSQTGTITYGGSCSSATRNALSGTNTIIFNTLTNGTYNNCTISVLNEEGEKSNLLTIPAFTIDTTMPASPSVLRIDDDTTHPYYTKNTTPTIYGTGTSGELITLTISDATYTGIVNISGNWSIHITKTLQPQQYLGRLFSTNTIGTNSTINNIDIVIETTATITPSRGGGGGGSWIVSTPQNNIQTGTTIIANPAKNTQAKTYTADMIYNKKINNLACHDQYDEITIIDSKKITTSDEFKKGLAFLSTYDITTFNDIDAFQPNARLSRQHAAKLFTKFAINVLCKQPDTSIKPNYNDIKDASDEMKDYITQAYQLGLMKGSANNSFRPFADISKAEFNAVLIRMLINTTLSEKSTPRYQSYNTLSTKIGIITQGADKTPISRQNATLMLSRAYHNHEYTQQTDKSFVLANYLQFIP